MRTAAGETTKTLMKGLISGVDQRRIIIGIALKRIELRKYLLSIGWKNSEIERLVETTQRSFQEGIEYARQIALKAGHSKRKQDYTWEKIMNYSKAFQGILS